jgi:hypothetical protein
LRVWKYYSARPVLALFFAMLQIAMPQKSEMQPSTSLQEPSEILKANSYWMKHYLGGYLPLELCERRARVSLRLKELYSSIPWYAQRAERDPEYWNLLCGSRVNWWAGPGSADPSTPWVPYDKAEEKA